jgi:hypothetical protein
MVSIRKKNLHWRSLFSRTKVRINFEYVLFSRTKVRINFEYVLTIQLQGFGFMVDHLEPRGP